MSAKTITDPLKRIVLVPEDFCQFQDLDTEQESEIQDELCSLVERTISCPAMMLDDDEIGKRYYYRAVNWQRTLLVETSLNQDDYIASSCELDPPSDLMRKIIEASRLVFENS